MYSVVAPLLISLSLCADSFAVSLCSGVGLRLPSERSGKILTVIWICLAFSVIHISFLLAGWMFGYALVGLVEKISHIIAFLLLLFVGGSMIFEALRGENESRDLNGLKNVVLAGVATSIDALAVGASQSMAGVNFYETIVLASCLFFMTAASVCLGLYGGVKLGERFGTAMQVAGGIVLVAIGVFVLV